jgi:hypothetical protein
VIEATNGWILCIALLAALGLASFVRHGAATALGVIVAASFVAPVWLLAPISGFPLRVPTCAAVIGLLLFTFRSPRQLLSPLVLLDLLIVSIMVVHAASDTFHDQALGASALRAYGEWAVPYFAGRYAMREVKSADRIACCLSIVVIALGVGGLVEMLTGMNFWEVIFGDRPVEGFSRDASRFGLKRAYGPTLHPIFFGLLILTLTPWPMALLNWARDRYERVLAATSLTSLVGIIAPVSRSPILGLAAMLALTSAIRVRWTRWIVGAMGILFATWMIVDFNSVLFTFESMVNEHRRPANFHLDGERVVMSSASQRLVLLQVYWPALRESGVLGYGTSATSMFPPRVPYLPKEDRARKVLRLVDNAYVLMGLRFGWSGTSLFLVLLLTAGWTGIRLAWDRSTGMLAACLGTSILSIAGVLTTVWFSYDMGFEILWSIGILAGLAARQKEALHVPTVVSAAR